MACPDFEELIRQGPAGHAAHCDDCRGRLEAWTEIDGAFTSAFADVSAPAGMAAAVRARVAREVPLRPPSILPEALDFIGWAAVLALAAVLLPQLLLRLGIVLIR
ncbi:MAG TPA: hypothetical protein VMI94_15630 [Bryobacteraceae bacterium]|nr:hypothetical protein [Bryobacteraceae bacterium]